MCLGLPAAVLVSKLVPVDTEPWFHLPKQEEKPAFRQNMSLRAAGQPGEVLCQAHAGCGSWWS